MLSERNMNIFNWLIDRFSGSSTVDDRTFEELLTEKNVSKALALMTDNVAIVQKAMDFYRIEKHSIMERQDKAVWGRKNPETGVREFLRWDKRWKIPVPYTVFINEIALVFLYGRPVKWSQSSENTDVAFAAFVEWMSRIRFDSKVRAAKRLAGAETQSAMLFHTFRNKEGKADMLIKVCARSLGDELYYRKDQFDRLTSFARGYMLQEGGGRTVRHIDFYTRDKIFLCRKVNFGWEVEEQLNVAGKIPVILFEQEPEWDQVELMIERRDWMVSRLADVNDRFSDPTLVTIGDKVLSLPDKQEESKAIHIKPEDGRQADVRYLTWDAASESKKLEGQELDTQILNKSFTPNISFEQLVGLSNVSGKALKQMMILGTIKAEKRKETHDEYISRVGSLMRSLIGNVLDVRLKGEIERLSLVHEFQEPFAEDIQEMLSGLIQTYNAGGMSLDTFVELNPLIRDAEAEKKRLIAEQQAAEAEAAARAKMDLFGSAE
jgi:SPP1 family phage portal protein